MRIDEEGLEIREPSDDLGAGPLLDDDIDVGWLARLRLQLRRLSSIAVYDVVWLAEAIVVEDALLQCTTADSS